MKKIILGLLFAVSVFSACAFAEDIKQVTTETLFYIKATHTVPENAFKNFSVFDSANNPEKMRGQLTSFLRSCQPYNENININFFGFDASLNIHSDGKINEKCLYEFSGNVNKIPEALPESPRMSNEQLLSMAPKVKCKFTQDQLDAIVDFVDEYMKEMDYKKPGFSKEKAKENLKNKFKNDPRLIEMFKEKNACELVSLTKDNL